MTQSTHWVEVWKRIVQGPLGRCGSLQQGAQTFQLPSRYSSYMVGKMDHCGQRERQAVCRVARWEGGWL